MAEIWNESDTDPSLLLSRSVAIIGYGNQGAAQARVLRMQGVSPLIGGRPGPSFDRAVSDGFLVVSPIEAAKADLVMMAIPDLAAGQVYEAIEGHLQPKACLAFCHGYSIRFGLVEPRPDLDVILVAPKGAGAKLAERFVHGSGLAAMIGVEQDATGNAWELAKAYAWGIGCARVGLIASSFQEETDTDLFSEQSVLCGGIPELLKAAFETLVEAGYQPEAAYFECIHEARLILEMIDQHGIGGMRARISDTAAYGGLSTGKRIITDEVRRAMKETLQRIKSGEFDRQWQDEAEAGRPSLVAGIADEEAHLSQLVGDEIRRRMPLLG